MLAAVLRGPASPIPPLFPAPARPLIHLSRRLPAAPMADAKKTDAPPAPAPEPPEKPLPGDCCGSGCVRCVWDIYYDELQDYQKALAAHEAAREPSGDKAAAKDDKAKS
ncbi:NADH-cytochrome b5 reductase-like [Lolium rigidum]|uniref:NADH-cytochrome b5 reductase-like n=1 Tax=Lolium rigidum TaxID=89674 RepID=UPI001F5CAB1D|nr:NADH-cytochrome b5 reductase-like [Lolium rigidum]